jgi:hypothetical protein
MVNKKVKSRELLMERERPPTFCNLSPNKLLIIQILSFLSKCVQISFYTEKPLEF